jgi:hypothetical protein
MLQMMVLVDAPIVNLSISHYGKTKIDKGYLPNDVIYKTNKGVKTLFDVSDYLLDYLDFYIIPTFNKNGDFTPEENDWEDLSIPREVFDVVYREFERGSLIYENFIHAIGAGYIDTNAGIYPAATTQFVGIMGGSTHVTITFYLRWNDDKDCAQYVSSKS